MTTAYASERQYLEHLAPIVEAAGLELYVSGNLRGHRLAAGARRGIPPAGSVLVASYRDLRAVRAPGRRIILLEHGAGQSYSNDTPAHPGGADRDDVILFLCPNENVAERNRAVYPNAAIAVVGCPKLDRWHGTPAAPQSRDHRSATIALAWHWDCYLSPEAGSAFRHFRPALADLAAVFGGRVLGHGHPRIMGDLEPVYRAAGIEPVAEFSEVLDRADLLVFDITSAGYEFASTGRPVVVCNAPAYRRDVSHGLRFWDAIPGLMVDGPEMLVPAVLYALTDPPDLRAIREAAVDAVYASRDGRAAERAAAAIIRLEQEVGS